MNKKIVLLVALMVVIVGFLSGCVKQGENFLLNSDFEKGIKGMPLFWFKADSPAEKLSMFWDNTTFYNGLKSLCIKNYHNYINDTCNNWAQVTLKIPIGRVIEISGWIKTISAEAVGMVVQCWGENNTIVGFGSTETHNLINGTNDWGFYNASVFVPFETKKIIVRLFLCGTGEVWFDDVKLFVK
jgi:hypothetical protein